MTASVQARAMRRTKELEAKGMSVRFVDVLREMMERDRNDSEREIAPAVAAEDAILLDNSDMTLEQNVAAVLNIIRDVAKERSK